METREEKELERFIDEQLRKLPEHEAPRELARNVMRTIAARGNLPWWKQPFTSWPRQNQMFLFALLAAVFSGVLYLAWAPAGQLTAGALAEKAKPFAWLPGLLNTMGSSMWLAVRNIPWTWMAALAVILTTMYAACVAAGVALYRVASPRPPRFL